MLWCAIAIVSLLSTVMAISSNRLPTMPIMHHTHQSYNSADARHHHLCPWQHPEDHYTFGCGPGVFFSSAPYTAHQRRILNKPNIHTSGVGVWVDQYAELATGIAGKEVVGVCEAANHVSSVFVLYADVRSVPSRWLFKTQASGVGLEELLLGNIVIDSWVSHKHRLRVFSVSSRALLLTPVAAAAVASSGR